MGRELPPELGQMVFLGACGVSVASATCQERLCLSPTQEAMRGGDLEKLGPSLVVGAGHPKKEPGSRLFVYASACRRCAWAISPAVCKFKFCPFPFLLTSSSPQGLPGTNPLLPSLESFSVFPLFGSCYLFQLTEAMSVSALSYPTPTPVPKMVSVCLASWQGLLCIWVCQHPYSEGPGPC
jgi:hypothetical protein